MIKKLILLIATFAVISIAFTIYQWQDTPMPAPPPQPEVRQATTRPESSARTTQPAIRLEDRQTRTLELTNFRIPEGEWPEVRVFDEKSGELKYYFKAAEWKPIGGSGTEFAVTQPNAEILLPGGQKAYVRADEGNIVVQRGDGNNVDPRRGWFKGNVQIVVDRTKPEWRKANPHLADPETHPETLVRFWLEEVRFDMDLAQLISDGPVKMESVDGSLEGKGLELVWNEVSRRITKLRIAEGRQATLRMSNRLDFAPSGDSPIGSRQSETTPADAEPPVIADAEVASEDESAKEDEPLQGNLFVDEDKPDPLKADRIDTYHVVFRENVDAEQREGDKLVGRLKANMIQLLLEVGQSEREAVQHVPTSRPATRAAETVAQTAPAGTEKPAQPVSTVVLKWTGEMLVTPEIPAGAPEEQRVGKAERIHLTAIGDPVEVHSQQTGEAHCRKLEYHQETKQVWLTGSPETPVRMKSGPNGELFAEKVFFDGKTGMAVVNGPGRLVTSQKLRSASEPELPECMVEALGKQAPSESGQPESDDDAAPRVLAWKKSARIQFDLAAIEVQDPKTGQTGTRRVEYLKLAEFRGDVSLDEPDQSMAADYVQVTFKPPTSAGASREEAIVEHITARGNVRMTSTTDKITCDSLDVDLIVDAFGNNVPQTGRAVGNVLARQGDRQIRARDELLITMGSAPKRIPPEQRKRLEAAARACGFSPDSPEWKAYETRNREVTITALTARGQVSVLDPTEGLDLAADSLDCTFNEQRQIVEATILGETDAPAHVETSDFYIRGPRVLFDMQAESAEVPGAGMLRFFTTQDLDGRPVDQPIPVVVTWTNRMVLDGKTNNGVFSGSVKARTDNSALNCHELRLGFQNQPKPSAEPSARQTVWGLRPLLSLVRREPASENPVTRLNDRIGKRLASLRAIGDASIEMKSYEDAPPAKGFIARTLVATVPDWLQQPPAAQATDQGSHRRLISGAYISGPQIVIDLINEYLIVKGKGSLLLRDYRVPERRAEAAGQSSKSLLSGASAESLTSYSPGHTVFTWQNGMTYLNQRNIAVFDEQIEMVHRSGSELKMSQELATVTGLSAQDLATLKGRKVSLTTNHLVVEFRRDAAGGRSTDTPSLSQSTRLKSFTAAGRVHMQEGGRSLEGAEISYSDESGLVRAIGTPRNPPQAMDVDEKTGALRASWRGDYVEWNVKTGQVRAKNSRILAPGG